MKFAAAALLFATLVAFSYARPMFESNDMSEFFPMMQPESLMAHFFPFMFGRFPSYQSHPNHHHNKHRHQHRQQMKNMLNQLFGEHQWSMVDEFEHEQEQTSLPSVEEVVEIIKNNGTDKSGKWNVISMDTDGPRQHVTLVSKDNTTVVDMAIMSHVFKLDNATTVISSEKEVVETVTIETQVSESAETTTTITTTAATTIAEATTPEETITTTIAEATTPEETTTTTTVVTPTTMSNAVEEEPTTKATTVAEDTHEATTEEAHVTTTEATEEVKH